MGLLGRKQSKNEKPQDDGLAHGGYLPKEKISKEDEKHLKFRSENVHDPILDAVNELQPFEQQQNLNHQRMSSLSALQGMKDIFGNSITQADISNPTRARDERPMDTIRSFEYAITGDPMFREQLETPHLGWRLRSGFAYDGGNNFAGANQYLGQQGYGMQQPPQQQYEQLIYTPPLPKVEEKKKRGFFGRKKK